jgi:hypothetical protein
VAQGVRADGLVDAGAAGDAAHDAAGAVPVHALTIGVAGRIGPSSRCAPDVGARLTPLEYAEYVSGRCATSDTGVARYVSPSAAAHNGSSSASPDQVGLVVVHWAHAGTSRASHCSMTPTACSMGSPNRIGTTAAFGAPVLDARSMHRLVIENESIKSAPTSSYKR